MTKKMPQVMSNVKFTRLGEHPEVPPHRKSCLMYTGIVGSMMFFVLYMTYSADMATNAVNYEIITQAARAHLNVTAVTESSGNASHSSPKPIQTNSSQHSDNSTSSTTESSGSSLRLDSPVIPEIQNSSEMNEKYAIYTRKCRIRDYDFNEAAMKKKYFSNTPKQCPANAKPFIYKVKLNTTLGYSCIEMDNAVVQKHFPDFSKWNCSYKQVQRDDAYTVIDRHYKFGKAESFKAGDCIKKEFLWIECSDKNKNGTLYEQPLMLPMVKEVKYPVYSNNIEKKPLNVLVVGLDSVSRLNAHRQFSKTMKYLKQKKNLVELFGYNKIGLNSAPNQIPLLSGITYRDGPGPGMSTRVKKNYFDNLTRFLWDEFEERGYRTMFYEEQWVYGLFVYSALNGFKKAPTTYWPRPMMQAIDKSKLKAAGSGGWCIGPDFPAKHYLDYTYNTMKLLGEDKPLFSYSWLSETAHDDVNGGRRVDDYFLDFFTKMDKDGILNRTAVFFISDHGFRFGAFRKTALGAYEDMLPYGFVLMPDSYVQEVPEAQKNLEANSRRLVTVYDLHTTMLELADAWSEGRTVRTSNGFSLLSNVIPEERNCEDADINFQFCSCFEPQPYERTGKFAKSLSAFVLQTVNAKVKDNNATSKCHEWQIDEVDSFSRLSEGSMWTDFFKISMKMKPNAQFEATAKFVEKNQTWTFQADVDRTDWFSSNAKCVKGSSYERFCYCK